MNANCKRFQKWISAYADGEAKPRERDQLETHLFGCGECRARLEALASLSAAISDRFDAVADEADFSGFSAKVFQKIGTEKPGLLERVRVYWSEVFAHHRVAVLSSMATAVATLAVAVPVVYHYASQRTMADVIVEKIELEDPSVQPVVMNMGDGKTLIMLVRHTDAASGDGQPIEIENEPPKGGDL